jgi:GNAT superfamily N-acetyltransferase
MGAGHNSRVIEARAIGGEHPEARRMLAAMEANVGRVYGPVDGAVTSVVGPSEMVPPRGEYVALWVDGHAVAGGGVRSLDEPRVGEVKRMWVEPSFRGRGLGTRLLAEIEAAAAGLGFGVLRLDTAGSIADFYLAAGYVPIADYNGNVYATFWGEKRLDAAGERRH